MCPALINEQRRQAGLVPLSEAATGCAGLYQPYSAQSRCALWRGLPRPDGGYRPTIAHALHSRRRQPQHAAQPAHPGSHRPRGAMWVVESTTIGNFAIQLAQHSPGKARDRPVGEEARRRHRPTLREGVCTAKVPQVKSHSLRRIKTRLKPLKRDLTAAGYPALGIAEW